jgi:spore maturation protein SpmB
MTAPRSDMFVDGGVELFCMAKRSVPAVVMGAVDGPGLL